MRSPLRVSVSLEAPDLHAGATSPLPAALELAYGAIDCFKGRLGRMTGLDYFTFVVLAILLAAGFALAFVLGSLPGKIAVARRHPQAEAIQLAGWLGILTLGVLYPFALIWAYTKPSAADEIETLRQQVRRLGERIDAVERGHAGSVEQAPAGS